jgi:hypothetical protein
MTREGQSNGGKTRQALFCFSIGYRPKTAESGFELQWSRSGQLDCYRMFLKVVAQ